MDNGENFTSDGRIYDEINSARINSISEYDYGRTRHENLYTGTPQPPIAYQNEVFPESGMYLTPLNEWSVGPFQIWEHTTIKRDALSINWEYPNFRFFDSMNWYKSFMFEWYDN